MVAFCLNIDKGAADKDGEGAPGLGGVHKYSRLVLIEQ